MLGVANIEHFYRENREHSSLLQEGIINENLI